MSLRIVYKTFYGLNDMCGYFFELSSIFSESWRPRKNTRNDQNAYHKYMLNDQRDFLKNQACCASVYVHCICDRIIKFNWYVALMTGRLEVKSTFLTLQVVCDCMLTWQQIPVLHTISEMKQTSSSGVSCGQFHPGIDGLTVWTLAVQSSIISSISEQHSVHSIVTN